MMVCIGREKPTLVKKKFFVLKYKIKLSLPKNIFYFKKI